MDQESIVRVEVQHLEQVLAEIDHQLDQIGPRYYGDDFTEQALDAQKQARREMLETLEREPYFARLDFQEDGMEQPVSYYIGKRGLDKHDTNELPSMQSCFLLFQVSALRGAVQQQQSLYFFISNAEMQIS